MEFNTLGEVSALPLLRTAGPEPSASFSLRAFINTVLARRYLVLCGPLVGVVLGGLYCLASPKQFVSSAEVLIESRSNPVSAHDNNEGGSPLEIAEVESQVALIRSDKIVRSAIGTLSPASLAELDTADTSALARLSGLVATARHALVAPFRDDGGPAKPVDPMRVRIGTVGGQLNVRRVGLGYVVEISVTARSPSLATALAQSVANAYVRDQVESKSDLWRSAGDWLQQRLVELGGQANTAARIAQEYKASHQIVDTGNHTLVNEQQMQEINTALLAARAKTVEAASKLDQVDKLLASGNVGGVVSDELSDDVVTRLRQQYAEMTQRESELEKKYGPTHDAVITMRENMKANRDALQRELQRVDQTLKADYQVALARQNSLEASFGTLLDQSSVTNRARVRSHELDRTADAYETLYTSLLQRYTDAVNQQSFPLPTAQIISPATEPTSPSTPRLGLSLMFGALIGAGLGVAAAFAREANDFSLQHAGQIEQLGLPCYAVLPILEREPEFSQQRIAQHMGDIAQPAASKRFKSEFLLHVPESYFAHGFRQVKTQIATSGTARGAKVIGVTSPASGEGKSTFAANLAHLFTRPNCRTLLIDADFGNPSLSRLLSVIPSVGLSEILLGEESLRDAMMPLDTSDLMFLSAGVRPHPQDADLFGSPRMGAILDDARRTFDCIIVDLPPVSQVASTREISPFLDGIILLAAWRETQVADLRAAIDAFAFDRGKVMGVVLNKTAAGGLAERRSYYDYLAHYRSRAAA